jgi:hypothetical protein
MAFAHWRGRDGMGPGMMERTRERMGRPGGMGPGGMGGGRPGQGDGERRPLT